MCAKAKFPRRIHFRFRTIEGKLRCVGDMKKVPEFKSEDEEFEFWSTADSTEYVDGSQAKRVKLVNLKPALRTISVLIFAFFLLLGAGLPARAASSSAEAAHLQVQLV